MIPEERRTEIVNIVNDRHGCSVAELAATLDFSEATIRRDLAELEEQGLLERTHGGATPVVDQRKPYEQRMVEQLEQKETIAGRAAKEIHKDQIVFFDSGSTTLQIAEEISKDHEIVAVTNGVMNAFELARKNVRVHLAGGTFWTETNAVVGPWTQERIQEMNFDLLFLGTEGVDTDGLTTQNVQQRGVKERMIANSRRVVLVADSSKFGEEHFVRFADPGDIDMLITGGELSEEIYEAYEAAGVELVANL